MVLFMVCTTGLLFDRMTHYQNEDGTRYRLFGDRLDPWDERDNPYWIVNRNHMYDDIDRFNGMLSIKADIANGGLFLIK